MEAGRFEEMGHKLCRRLVVLLTEDDGAHAAPSGVGHAMMVVAVSWFMAAPLICVGGLMDRLVEHLSEYPALELDGSPCAFDPLAVDDGAHPVMVNGHPIDPEQAFWEEEERALYGWHEGVQEVPAVVVDT